MGYYKIGKNSRPPNNMDYSEKWLFSTNRRFVMNQFVLSFMREIYFRTIFDVFCSMTLCPVRLCLLYIRCRSHIFRSLQEICMRHRKPALTSYPHVYSDIVLYLTDFSYSLNQFGSLHTILLIRIQQGTRILFADLSFIYQKYGRSFLPPETFQTLIYEKIAWSIIQHH